MRSSQATPARRRGQPCIAVNPAELHLSSPDSCSNGWGHLSLLELQAADLRHELALQQRELRTFADKVATKRWLKREQRRLRDEDAFDGDFF